MTGLSTCSRPGLCAMCIAVAVSVPGRARAVDPSDITQSSYAAPVRGDVIAWRPSRAAGLDVVAFESGSAVLRASARAALVSAFAHQGPGVRAEVTGRPDLEGPPAMGVARAVAIRRALLSAGMAVDRIAIVADPAGDVQAGPSRPLDSFVRWNRVEGDAAPLRRDVIAASSPPPSTAAVTAAAAASMPGSAAPVWEVLTQDITLARTLERWAAMAGYRLRWDADRNFLIAASDRYEGSFEAALRSVLVSAGIRESDYPLEACVYANRPPLVRITRMGEQARECEAP